MSRFFVDIINNNKYNVPMKRMAVVLTFIASFVLTACSNIAVSYEKFANEANKTNPDNQVYKTATISYKYRLEQKVIDEDKYQSDLNKAYISGGGKVKLKTYIDKQEESVDIEYSFNKDTKTWESKTSESVTYELINNHLSIAIGSMSEEDIKGEFNEFTLNLNAIKYFLNPFRLELDLSKTLYKDEIATGYANQQDMAKYMKSEKLSIKNIFGWDKYGNATYSHFTYNDTASIDVKNFEKYINKNLSSYRITVDLSAIKTIWIKYSINLDVKYYE